MNPGAYRWAVVGMLWLVCLFNYADRQAIFSVLDPLKAELDLTDVQLGLFGGAFSYVYAIIMPFAGLVGDRISRKALILGGLAFWSAITLATGFAQTYWQLILFRALEGFGEAFYFPASMSLISSYHGKASRSRAMAFHQSSVYAGTVLGGWVAGACGQYLGWRFGFWLFGGAGVLLAVVLLITLREPPRGAADADEPPATVGDLVRGAGELFVNRMVWVLLWVFVGTVFVGSIFLAWTPTYLKRQYGQGLAMAGLYATLFLQSASVLGVVTGGWAADRLARRYRSGRMLVMMAGLFAGGPMLYFAGGATSLELFLAILTAFGFCKGLYDSNTWASLYDVVRPRQRATAVGLVNGLGWLVGGATAPVVYALAAERFGPGASIAALSFVYWCTGGLLLGGVAAFLPLHRLPHKEYDR